MNRVVVVVTCAVMVAGHRARADRPAPDDTIVERARGHFARGELAEARALLLEAYRRTPDPALLFALGQVELRLGHAKAAIAYYDRFLATNPDDEQAALAQQAIGAARMQLARPPAPPRRVTRRRSWDVEGTGLVVLGGAAIVGGAGLVYYGRRLGDDRRGTLTAYDHRLALARTTQWIGAATGAAGAILIGVAIVRWRMSSETVELGASATAGGAAITLGRRW